MNVFTYDNGNNRLEINEPEILFNYNQPPK